MVTLKETLKVKLAETTAELRAAQRLRYRVFVEEMAQPESASQSTGFNAYGLETDSYDLACEHLILLDKSNPDPENNVVATYRLLTSAAAARGIGFYSETEFDLSPIVNSNRRCLELGRSCVAPAYRGGGAMHLLWQGLADYVSRHQIELLFGVASFAGTDVSKVQHGLKLLFQDHVAPRDFPVKPRVKSGETTEKLQGLSFDRKQAVREIPSLIKAYIRLGGFVADGYFIDRNFNTIDVFMMLETQQLLAKMQARHVSGRAA